MNRSILAALIVLVVVRPSSAAKNDVTSLAEQAIKAKYAAEKLDYEKYQAERTIKSSQSRIKGWEKSVPKLRMTVAKAEKELQTARTDHSNKAAAEEQARTKAEESGADADKATADKLRKELEAALKALRSKEGVFKREQSRLQRTEESWKQAEQAIADAQAAIPLKDAAAKSAHAEAIDLKEQSLVFDRNHAAAQNPQDVAAAIDALIDARLAKEELAASGQADDGEFHIVFRSTRREQFQRTKMSSLFWKTRVPTNALRRSTACWPMSGSVGISLNDFAR